MSTAGPSGPLAGIRVIELGQLLAGPFCGQLFADYGAEVVKIEEPRSGDPMRQWGRAKLEGQSLWWPIISRNKKSVTIDLRRQEGQTLVRRLAAKCDLLIENFRPGTLERWNLGYDRLSMENPGLILVRISGFGQTGPYASRAGFGSIGEAIGGLRYVSGDPSTPPSRIGISIGDSLAGIFGALGGLVALQNRTRTGRGQVVDVAIYEAVLAVMESLISEYDLAGFVRERTGAITPNVAPSNVYPTATGQGILIAANHDSIFRRLAELMGEPGLADDPRFRSHSARGNHQEELDEVISRWSLEKDPEELVDSLNAAGVPAGMMYRAPEMLRDPHFNARGSIVRVPDPKFGTVPMQNVVPRLSESPGTVAWTGPKLGEHTREVLSGLVGMSDEEIEGLQRLGVV
jgi:formyl-CoA transferase